MKRQYDLIDMLLAISITVALAYFGYHVYHSARTAQTPAPATNASGKLEKSEPTIVFGANGLADLQVELTCGKPESIQQALESTRFTHPLLVLDGGEDGESVVVMHNEGYAVVVVTDAKRDLLCMVAAGQWRIKRFDASELSSGS